MHAETCICRDSLWTQESFTFAEPCWSQLRLRCTQAADEDACAATTRRPSVAGETLTAPFTCQQLSAIKPWIKTVIIHDGARLFTRSTLGKHGLNSLNFDGPPLNYF